MKLIQIGMSMVRLVFQVRGMDRMERMAWPAKVRFGSGILTCGE